MNKEVNATAGVTFLGLLQIVFIVLKIIGKINWSWWLVLLPTWIDISICIIIIAIAIWIASMSNKR